MDREVEVSYRTGRPAPPPTCAPAEGRASPAALLPDFTPRPPHSRRARVPREQTRPGENWGEPGRGEEEGRRGSPGGHKFPPHPRAGSRARLPPWKAQPPILPAGRSRPPPPLPAPAPGSRRRAQPAPATPGAPTPPPTPARRPPKLSRLPKARSSAAPGPRPEVGPAPAGGTSRVPRRRALAHFGDPGRAPKPGELRQGRAHGHMERVSRSPPPAPSEGRKLPQHPPFAARRRRRRLLPPPPSLPPPLPTPSASRSGTQLSRPGSILAAAARGCLPPAPAPKGCASVSARPPRRSRCARSGRSASAASGAAGAAAAPLARRQPPRSLARTPRGSSAHPGTARDVTGGREVAPAYS